MQIFEVTKKPMNEGILSNIGAIGKAVGSAATSAMAQNLEKTTGVSFEPDKNPYGAKKSEADAAAAPLVKQQAEKQQKLWNTALTKTMQSRNVSDPRQLDSGTKQEIAKSLMNQIHSTLLQNKVGYDYRRLGNYVDGNSQQQAQDIVNRLENARKSILNFNAPNKTPQQSMAEWQELAKAAYDAMSLVQFNSKTGFGKSNAQQQQKQQQAKTQTPGVQKATANLKAAGLTQDAIDAVQKVMGPLPPVSSRDQRTMDYLAAIGLEP